MGDELARAFWPIWLLGKRTSARQNNLDFGELARLCLDLDRTTVLLHDDVMTD